jgi:hypothetical protein
MCGARMIAAVCPRPAQRGEGKGEGSVVIGALRFDRGAVPLSRRPYGRRPLPAFAYRSHTSRTATKVSAE